MRKIYILFNSDINQITCATEDKSLAEEYMMDAFIEDVEYQWYYNQQYNSHFDPYKEASAIWDDVLTWYTDYVEIFESEVL